MKHLSFSYIQKKKKKKPYEINPSTEINSDSLGLCYRGCCYVRLAHGLHGLKTGPYEFNFSFIFFFFHYMWCLAVFRFSSSDL